MYALQRALRQRMDEGLDWLTIRRYPSGPEVLPWFWRSDQRLYLAYWNRLARPFVSGPYMAFLDARRPRIDPEECEVLDARHTRAMFCNSEWYRELLESQRQWTNRCPIVVWPAPIDPWPPGPREAEWDLLIYAKNGYETTLIDSLRAAFPRSVLIVYGRYERQELWEVARRSRACAYLADNDHGPLALQEILLSGCPTVGVRTGAPYVEDGVTGFLVSQLPTSSGGQRALENYLDHLRRARTLHRSVVRSAAADRFQTACIVDRVLDALELARVRGPRPGTGS